MKNFLNCLIDLTVQPIGKWPREINAYTSPTHDRDIMFAKTKSLDKWQFTYHIIQNILKKKIFDIFFW